MRVLVVDVGGTHVKVLATVGPPSGQMLFLGLGTGLGSTLIVDGIVEPMELGHLPYRDGTFEQRPPARRLAAGLPGRRQRERVPRGFSPVGVNARWAERIRRNEGTSDDGNVATDCAPIVEGAPGPPREDPTLHLRSLFADDPTRGERLTAEARRPLSRLLEESHHGRDPRAALSAGRGVRPARAHRRDVPGRQDQRDREPGRPACRPARAARHARSSSTARTSCPRSTPCSTRWPTSRTACAAGRGRGTPASASATSSTSASAAPTSAP